MKKVLLVLAIGFGVLFFNSCTDNIEEIENRNEKQQQRVLRLVDPSDDGTIEDGDITED